MNENTTTIILVVLGIIAVFIFLVVLPFLLRLLSEVWDFAIFGSWI